MQRPPGTRPAASAPLVPWRRRQALAAAAVAVAGAVVSSSASRAGDAAPIAFAHVDVVDLDRDARCATTRSSSATGASNVEVPANAMVIDGAGRYLAPGLTDAHVHLDELIQARPGFGDAPLFLTHGVTTVINLRGTSDHLEAKRRIAAGELVAPNLYPLASLSTSRE